MKEIYEEATNQSKMVYEAQKEEIFNNTLKENKKLNQEIERLKEQLSDEIDDELKQSEIMVKKQEEIERLNNIINKTIEYIENEMPCLLEVDDVWEDINGNYQHNYKEYDTKILLNTLKGVDKE